MVRVLFIIFFSFSALFADILSIHKKVVPVSLLQITDIVKKENKEIELAIIVSEEEIVRALEFKESLPKKFKMYNLHLSIIYEKDLQTNLTNQIKNFDALYIFDVSINSYQLIYEYAIKNKLVTFASSFNGLDNKMLLYVDFRDKIGIYINKETMKETKVVFDTRFLRMLKIYEK